MIDISYEKNTEYYENLDASLNFLKDVHNSDEYEYPEEIVCFHTLMGQGVLHEPWLECIKSYLATQNLEKTKFILWTEEDDTDNELIQPYKEYIEMRVWDVHKEAMGTPLENNEKLLTRDAKYYSQGDLFRILVLYNYGGIWIDADSVFINDFKPILDQEFVYQWGKVTNYAKEGMSGGVMSVKKGGEFAKKLIQQLVESPHVVHSDICWGNMLLRELWSKWPNNWTVFPSTFFNTEWSFPEWFKEQGFNNLAPQTQWFDEELEHRENMFDNAPFSWHWHYSGEHAQKAIATNTIAENSKFGLLRQRNDIKLKERGIL